MENSSLLFVDDYEEPLCEEVSVIEKRIKIPSGEEELLIKVNSRGNGIPFVVSREEFVQKRFFNKLTLHGLSIIESDEAYKELRESVNDSEKRAPIVYIHEKMGFRDFEGKKYFFAYNPICSEKNKYSSSINKNMQNMLEPKGSFVEWRSFIRKHIVPHTERSLAMMLGASAPLAYILKEESIFVDLPVYALINASSTGKTTLLYIISSMVSNPKCFIGNFNATTGALYAMLEQNGGLPYLCDEATYVPSIDWDDLLYVLPTGKEKRRLNSKGELKPLVDFSGAVIMTSETSILGRSKGTGGENCRILEFNLNCFENEPFLPDEVRRVCFQNYGWATEPLIKLLLDETYKQRIIDKYRSFTASLLKSATFAITGIERRLIARCALILTAGWLLKKAIMCNFDLKATEKYLLKHLNDIVANHENRDEADILIDRVTGFVCANLEKFPTVESLYPTSKNKRFSSFWGATGYEGLDFCILIQEDVLKGRILTKEMQNANLTLQALHKKGFVRKYYDKNYRIKKNFGGIESKYYCFSPPQESLLKKKIVDSTAFAGGISASGATIGAVTDINFNEFLDARKEIEYVSISHSDMQSYALCISKLLKKQMHMASRSTLYASPLPAQKTLLLSKTKVAGNSIPCYFDTNDDVCCAKGVSVVNIASLLELNVPIGHQAVSLKVQVEMINDSPIAAITFDCNTSIEPVEDPPVDFNLLHTPKKRSYTNIPSLLSDDEE